MRDLGVFKWAEKKIKEGKIGYLGFSFHDELPLFKEIVDAHDWTSARYSTTIWTPSTRRAQRGYTTLRRRGSPSSSWSPSRADASP